jgi:hypothetical protein
LTDGNDKLTAFLESKPKTVQSLALLLHAAYTEECDDLDSLASEAEQHKVLFDVHDAKPAAGSILKPLNDWLKALSVQDHIVGVAAPLPSLRFLARRQSEAEDSGDPTKTTAAAVEERNQVWNKAQVQRRKLCQIAVFKDEKQAETALKNSAVTKLFKPTVGESHRLFVFSADLAHETDQQPWMQPSSVPANSKACNARSSYSSLQILYSCKSCTHIEV